jgi:hypothetical protein
MKNFMSIRKLYEDFDPTEVDQEMQAQMPMQMNPPAPIQPMDQMGQEEPIDPTETQEPVEPMYQSQQKALPNFDPMNLTVAQFIERCDKINPLVCMGLTSFIESNSEALANEVNGGEEFDLDKEANLDFPPAEGQSDEQQPDFSLDQPASDLNFPQQQTAEI